MKHFLAFIFTCLILQAQGTQPATSPGFQPIENANDERLKVFKELEFKAEAGETEALSKLGHYYFQGQFPVLKNEEKAKEIWVKGASLGSDQCASWMYGLAFPKNNNDSDVVIERTKWYIIQSVLHRMNYFGGDTEYPSGLRGVSESSFEEAKVRAAVFLAGVKTSKSPTKASSKKGVGSMIGQDTITRKSKVPGLRFDSLSLFDAHRRNVCAAYIKASNPIYSKGESASEDEKAAFTAAALELVRLQSYIGKTRRLGLNSNSNSAMRALNAEKMNDYYAKMSAAKIATALPASRTELNEASTYINALGNLMQLPVTLGSGY
jgi:hypothetical protein